MSLKIFFVLFYMNLKRTKILPQIALVLILYIVNIYILGEKDFENLNLFGYQKEVDQLENRKKLRKYLHGM